MAHTEERDILLVSQSEIDGLLKQGENNDSDAQHLAKAATIIRRGILGQEKIKNSFTRTAQERYERVQVVCTGILRESLVTKEVFD